MQAPEEDRVGPWRGRAAEKTFPALGDSAGAARGRLGPLPLCPWRSLGTEVLQREACGADEKRPGLAVPPGDEKEKELSGPSDSENCAFSLLLVLPNQKKGT